MAQRKVTILEPAVSAVAEIAYFIEGEGLPQTAKKFVDEAFLFFQELSEDILIYMPCKYRKWKDSGYRCAIFRKKYAVAYLSLKDEIVICDFVNMKLLYE